MDLFSSAIEEPTPPVSEIENPETYEAYHALSKYQRGNLACTNYWRIATGLEIIPVPPDDIEYYKYFTADRQQQAKEHYIKTQKLKSNEATHSFGPDGALPA